MLPLLNIYLLDDIGLNRNNWNISKRIINNPFTNRKLQFYSANTLATASSIFYLFCIEYLIFNQLESNISVPNQKTLSSL